MSERNKAIVRRFFEEIWNDGNLEIANEIIDNGYRQTDLTTGHQRIAGPPILQHEVEAYRSVTDDLHFDVVELIAEGNKVVAQWVATATLKDEDASPLGSTRGVTINHIRDGKIADIQLYSEGFTTNTAWLPEITLS
jgi:ketosteroid isomerase-like protein